MQIRKTTLLIGGALAVLAAQVAYAKEAQGPATAPATQPAPAAGWPKAVKAQPDAPNIVLVLLDDVGFGATSTFGGAAATPNLDQLAASGLSFNQFHTTALCSPTRAALLTGRNAHQVGFGTVVEGASPNPGYHATWGREFVSVAEVLRKGGYSTAAFGKWHNTPDWEINAVGPFDRWPTGLGFEYFYGFQLGETSQWEPQLYRNTVAVEPNRKPDQGYHLTTDLVDDAVHWVRQHEAVAAEKPWFLYFAPGATHAPHHVPPEWIAKYRGKFDQGWDKLREETFARQKRLGVIPQNAELTPRPAELPAWDSLSTEQKKVYARQMEVYAAFLEQTDHEVGRLLDEVRKGPKSDNTLVLYVVGDNGGSAEGSLDGSIANFAGFFAQVKDTLDEQLRTLDEIGGPRHDNHYASAWAWATTTPFQWTKQVASHFGGTRNPLIVSWPAKIKARGEIRSQFSHVNDIAPTIYELAGVKFPEVVDGVKQKPLEGRSLAYTFEHADAPTRHTRQYFELGGNRAIYQDGWVAGARYGVPWELFNKPGRPEDARWELYHVAEDFSEAHDLAAKYPDRLKALQREFDREATRNQVYPLSPIVSLDDTSRPYASLGKTSFTYRAGVTRVPQGSAPDLGNRSHRITATVDIPESGAEGVLIAQGGRHGGFSLYVKDGRLVYENNFVSKRTDRLVSSIALPHGKVELGFEFLADGRKPLGGGTGRLTINGQPAGETHFASFGGFRGSDTETLDIGEETGSPVSQAYATPYRFSGTLDTVRVDLL
ncbi:arylsulfatase [Azoarcus sp. DN11]|uniref:arylsulfatase n=1 Tax=Azoarcus sp. DN11 TaxID=356837 RepID=UPI000EB0F678|nr:arylsulfatase [Azoarcus sp. DN11]AYH42915.1 arylsulfatase [Azoarcus sp. DN11]